MRCDIVIEEEHTGRILRAILGELLPNTTPKSIRRSIQRGQITVNGLKVRSDHMVQTGDEVMVHIQTTWRTQDTTIERLYEDDHIAVVFKPAGLITNSRKQPSLISACSKGLEPSSSADALVQPVGMHRLDKNTCGLVMVCKTRSAVAAVSRQFEQRLIIKEYYAVAHGSVNAPQSLNHPIGGRDAHTEIVSSEKRDSISILSLRLHTGRTHQIRRHLAGIGNPIVGDGRYGSKEKSQMLLCANRLTFAHPLSGEMITVEASVPDYFRSEEL